MSILACFRVEENVVYLELLRRGEGEVFVGKADDGEVDFVVQKAGGGREYYRVAYRVNGRPETLKRELAPLRRIRDNYPKMLLTMDLAPEEFEGIEKSEHDRLVTEIVGVCGSGATSQKCDF